jgi:glycosyltransferase involved in cell wall biosynthesis
MRYNRPIMRVLYAVSRELSYPRNDVILRAFRRFADVDVLGGRKRPRSLFAQSLKLTLGGLPRLLFRSYDLIFVGFYGHLMMLPFGLLGRGPVLFDAFVSTYDTLSEDRKTFTPGSVRGRLAYWLDRHACLLAQRVLLDTRPHSEYFKKAFGLPGSLISVLPVGCNEDLFYPQPPPQVHPITNLLYYTSYQPLHGVEVVVRAAALLQGEALSFRLIGDGQMYPEVLELAERLQVQNIQFVPPVSLESLPGEIAAADICLGGHFGESNKAGRVVPGKVYQVLAMQRPLIATSTPANLELLRHGESAYLCPPGDSQALAECILELHQGRDLREVLAAGGRAVYLEKCSEAYITECLREIVMKMIG